MLNAAKKVFSKVKAGVKRLLTNNTVKRSLIEVINEAIEFVTPKDCNTFVMDMLVKFATAAAGQSYIL